MSKKRIIVNADDCGYSKRVNEHIEKAILKGKITSTTVMANMDDFDGAVALYRKYKSVISFGWHINLTEGHPLLYSQLLLDKGYYIENGDTINFNGRAFWHKRLSKSMKKEIRKELICQYEKLRDNDIDISHADSHIHIHTSPSLMFFIPSLLTDLGISKMRRLRNYVPYSFSYFARQAVSGIVGLTHRKIRMPNSFCYFQEYIDNPSLPSGKVIEMECHPGSEIKRFQDEESHLLETTFDSNETELITYKIF